MDLLSFTATGAETSITLNWETASEIDNTGFNLYRATAQDGERTQLNETLIPTQGPDGAPYEYIDDDPALNTQEIYYYWLEAVDVDGVTTLYGPVSARLAQGMELLSFTASGNPRSITLNWETGSELDNTGFTLYRATAEDGERTQLNAELIPTQGPGGARYEYIDEDRALKRNETYFYWLEAVDVNGMAELYGPVSAGLGQ
jgi:hypothetical protein